MQTDRLPSLRRRPLLGALGLCTALAACGELPPLQQRSVSHALRDTQAQQTPLGRAIAPRAAAHPGTSGIHPLPDPHDAFAARVLLARAAQRTLDVQCYIWRADTTGTLLLEALREAADRDVRVRLLLDDNGTSGLDTELAALDTHPNIEVRLFNPFVVRKPKAIGFLTDFPRANRRMHNKSFTADNQATIVGGRNVGDEYFGATDGVLFADLDVLAVGPVVGDVSLDFDRYWTSRSAYSVDGLLPPVAPPRLREFANAASAIERSPVAAEYVAAIRESTFVQSLLSGGLAFEWAPTRMISDDPAKALGKAQPEDLLFPQLVDMLGAPQHALHLVSPYFVPTEAGVEAFTRFAAAGVRQRVLTNAFEATDVPAVHAGYAKRRKALLRAGITLYELKQSSTPNPADRHAGPFGSSGSSLHAKTFSVDDRRVFVGSFNFDPRSARLNTELGFVIESPALARTIRTSFDEHVPANAYEVRLSAEGKLYWIERGTGAEIRHDTEPGTTLWQRTLVRFLALLPIDWML